MKISSSKGETEISCFFFADSLTVMLSFGFQTTIIIVVGQRFPEEVVVNVFSSQTKQVSEKQTDCKYTKSVDAEES